MYKVKRGIALAVLSIILILPLPSFAQTGSVERAQGMARHWTNLAGFTAQCIDKKLLDKDHGKYARFGGYLGGFILGSIGVDQNTVQQTLAPYLQEGAGGRVHEFDEKGKFMAYDIEFTKENCATLGGALQTAFDQFSKAVMED